jgi:metallo-beta-lactamase family protein
MKVTPFGAASGEVTGSAYLVETDAAAVLVDFGMFQGNKESEGRNRLPWGPGSRPLDAVVVTHAHLDHTGRLPLLAQQDFEGPIFATPATLDMTRLILKDSAKVQAAEVARQNRKRELVGKSPLSPLYTNEDVERVAGCFRPAPYDTPLKVVPGLQATFVEAGHMLGSASVKLTAQEGGRSRSVVLSGDLGPKGAPILRDFTPFHAADAVYVEATYGDRDHKPFADTVAEFTSIVDEVVSRGGKMLVPTFAVGRAQVLLGLLAFLFRSGRVRPFPVYLDSPMAIEATKIYANHRELFDEETLAFTAEHTIREDLEKAHSRETVTAEESKALNDVPGPCMILAGAGMCNAGRILHHLRHNLDRPETAVLIVGYQGAGTLGRQLVEGKRSVSIFGERIEVKASVHTLGGFSAHAGQSDLLGWLEAMVPSKPRVVVSHGENPGRNALASKIRERFALDPQLAETRVTIEI